jgi:hypothetical protein
MWVGWLLVVAIKPGDLGKELAREEVSAPFGPLFSSTHRPRPAWGETI